MYHRGFVAMRCQVAARQLCVLHSPPRLLSRQSVLRPVMQRWVTLQASAHLLKVSHPMSFVLWWMVVV